MAKKKSMCDSISKQDLKKLSCKELSKKYGINRTTIIMWCKKNKIDLRPLPGWKNTLYENVYIVKKNGQWLFFQPGDKQIRYDDGVFSIRSKMGYDRDSFGILFGKAGRTVECWEQGRRKPTKSDMSHMKQLMEDMGFDEKKSGQKRTNADLWKD